MKQYLDLLQNILDNGVEKESGRANMPNTLGISFGVIQMDMAEGFPLLTTKKMYWKGIIHELLWFLRGDTNIKYLVDNNVNIWNGDAYRWYLKYCEEYNVEIYFKTQDDFVNFIKNKDEELNPSKRKFELRAHVNDLLHCGYTVGDLGKVYGYQWRNQNDVDQIRDVIEGLRDNPYSRYHIIDGWNKADFKEMALPPCHLLYQFIARPIKPEDRYRIYVANIDKYNPEKLSLSESKSFSETLNNLDRFNVPKFYLDLNMYQRSCDTFLGVPFNIASMSILLMIMAKVSNMIPGISTWIGGDTHLYVDHIPTVQEQLNRKPNGLPYLTINKDLKTLDDILFLTIDDFKLEGYDPHPPLKAELFTGLKK